MVRKMYECNASSSRFDEYSTSVQVKQDAMAELEALKAEGHKKWWDNFWTRSLFKTGKFKIFFGGGDALLHTTSRNLHSNPSFSCRNLDGSMFLFYVDRLDTCGYTRCFRLLIQVSPSLSISFPDTVSHHHVSRADSGHS